MQATRGICDDIPRKDPREMEVLTRNVQLGRSSEE
jgi:hypothetical protein